MFARIAAFRFGPEVGFWERSTPDSDPQLDYLAQVPQIAAPSLKYSSNNWPCLLRLHETLFRRPDWWTTPLRRAVDEFAESIDIFEAQSKGRKEYEVLRGKLEASFEELIDLKRGPPFRTKALDSLSLSIEWDLIFLQKKQDSDKGTSDAEVENDENDVLTSYRRIQDHFRRISLNFSARRAAEFTRTIGHSPSHQKDQLLHLWNEQIDLCRYHGAYKPYTEGTRIDVLAQIHTWIASRGSSSAYWINGMAGTGKTTIAYTLCEKLDAYDSSRKLAASFFHSRDRKSRDPRLIIPSIAYQLAEFSDPFRYALLGILGNSDLNLANNRLSPYLQFDLLIYRPLLEVKHTFPNNSVVVIDTLDGFEDKQGVSRLLDVLLARTADLPVKFVVSSRPEPEIREPMKKQKYQATSRVILHELDRHVVQADIKRHIQSHWQLSLSDGQTAALVERAGVLFGFATAAARYICLPTDGETQLQRFVNVIGASGMSGAWHLREVDELYTPILKAALDDPSIDEMDKDVMRRVLYMVVCNYSREILTINAISKWSKINSVDRIWAALRPLWSVLHVSEDSRTVTMLHPSFADYMLDPSRSRRYCCDPKFHTQTMAQHCFNSLRGMQPQFNVCGLELSYAPDSEVTGLKARVEDVIPANVFYSAQHWAVHLHSTTRTPELLKEVEEFLSMRLLLCMEIMNLKGCAYSVPEAIQLARNWAGMECSEELKELIHDAWKFSTVFAHGGISDSTPHIYTSMLSFWPKSSPIGVCYSKHMRGMIKSEGTAIGQRQHVQLATWNFDDSTRSSVYSPDGTLIAVGVGNEVLLLSASTGCLVLPPFKGHSNIVLSVQFLLDGTRIISSSLDKTIRVWDTVSGEIILQRYTTIVGSAAVSPDGALSVSIDDNIHILDSRSGRRVSTFTGCYESVAEIKYTPNGHYIVTCGRHDILVRDAENGKVLRSFRSKRSNVNFTSIDISSDNMHLAACGRDGIYIWNFQNERLTLGPLTTTNGYSIFTSISFSPDGSWLVSGACDGTLYMWDTRGGALVLGPLEGHTDSINSTRFSPNGVYIISSSNDKTIRFWDSRGTQEARELLTLPGHVGSVTSVALSPDGTHIVSSSADGTMSVWDTTSGEIVLGPLEKNNSDRMMITYSPNGAHILSSSPAGVVLRDTETGSVSVGPIGFQRSIQSALFSSDGNRIIVGSTGDTVQLLSAHTGETLIEIRPPLTSQSNHTHVTSAIFSPGGTHIAVGSMHFGLSMFDAGSGNLLYGPLDGHNNGSCSLAFSPNSQRVVSGEFSTILVRDAHNGGIVLGPLKGHSSWVHSVEYSPDGTQIVSGARDNAVCVWNAHTGQPDLGPVKWHTAPVRSVRYTPEGKRVVSGSDDKAIRVTGIGRDLQYLSDASTPTGCDWELKTDGWVVDTEGRLLVWIPPDLRTSLMWPRTELLISRKGWLRLDFTDACLGKSWAECYKPE
ncbi:unnamed protein product [Rhizoctonia solani]|uniref:Nephrocystin 3-like N-terminal domain-containing protein n=1 Tax=Rhizoctonia solani TaxID=456999 RepID=A0A8H2X913_9AGAM|nr:unnamed protein product [Rhizoctonia solani]